MPVSCPATANWSWPSASISATMSSAKVAVSYPSKGLPDSPQPRWSTATTAKSRASAGITRRHAYQVCGQPCTSSSGGPSPPVTACRRTLPVSTYRLVNVPVTPSGRCGAPATEPGPSGVNDELMRISSLACLFAQRPQARAGLYGKYLRLFPGREMSAFVKLVVIDEVLEFRPEDLRDRERSNRCRALGVSGHDRHANLLGSTPSRSRIGQRVAPVIS